MWCEKQKNGKIKYIERYKDPLTLKSKRVSVVMDKDTASNRKKALAELNRKIEEACYTKSNDKITLKILLNEYLNYQKNNVKMSTLKRNEIILNRCINLLGPDTIIDNIKVHYVRSIFEKQLEKISTRNTYTTRLKAMLNWGYQNELINNYDLILKLKPCEDKERKEKAKLKYLETDELMTLINSMENEKHWYYLTLFLIETGLRIGEVLSLLDKDVTDVIHVNKTFDSNNKIITSTKTEASERDVYVQKELKKLIVKIRKYNKIRMIQFGFKSDYFFFDDKGKPLRYDAYRKYLREKSIKEIGRAVTPHIMRHTHASMLIAKGVELETVTRRLGHNESDVTKDIYIHITNELRKHDNEQIENINLL